MARRAAGRISWYGGPHDAQDNNITSTGIKNSSVAGIATRYKDTKGGWWYLHPKGKPQQGQLVRDIETGPGKDTGREFDFNPRTAGLFGFKANDKDFPTDAEFEGTFLGRDHHRAAVLAARMKQPKARRRPPRTMPPPQMPQQMGLQQQMQQQQPQGRGQLQANSKQLPNLELGAQQVGPPNALAGIDVNELARLLKLLTQ